MKGEMKSCVFDMNDSISFLFGTSDKIGNKMYSTTTRLLMGLSSLKKRPISAVSSAVL